MRKSKMRQFEQSLIANMWTFEDYKKNLLNLAISVFKWNNLPDSCEERFIELMLCVNGSICFFKDDVSEQILSLKCSFGGGFDVYRNPTLRFVYADNGYTNKCTIEDSVICYNDLLRTNLIGFIENYAYKLYEVDRIIMTNLKAQKTPVLVKCSENERLTLLNMYKEYDGNQPFIFADKDFNMNSLECLKTDAPFVVDKLFKYKTDLYNEALTFLGIQNIQVHKKERLVRDEVQQMNAGSIASRFSRLKARKEACEKINAMFDTDISVEFTDYDKQNEAYDEIQNTGGGSIE